jgi:ComF family protein
VDRLILGLKYHRQLHVARSLGELLLRHAAPEERHMADVIIPVPLHVTRLRSRGYNQSLEIARPLARELAIPLDTQSIYRARATPAQANLPLQKRAANVRGAFACNTRFDGKHIVIVDDVMTSGHTVNAVAACLQRAGARSVEAWVVARA